MRTWLSASAQQKTTTEVEPDRTRLGVWPVLLPRDRRRLWAIDQVSIMLQSVGSNLEPLLVVREPDIVPRRWWNILACGFGAPITASMLFIGARLFEPCSRMFEPLLLFYEINPDYNLLGEGAVPGGLTRSDVLTLLADEETTVDALVWYDIGAPESFRYLQEIKRLREAHRAHCRLIVLEPFSHPAEAIHEFAQLRSGKSGLVIGARNLYAEVLHSIRSRRDSDPSGYLSRLSRE